MGLLNDYYSQLFSSSNPHDLNRILDGVDDVVTDEMRADLARPYTTEEVDAAIKELAPLKAPGLDRTLPLFYQTYWTDVGTDVHQAILSSLNSGPVRLNLFKHLIGFIPCQIFL